MFMRDDPEMERRGVRLSEPCRVPAVMVTGRPRVGLAPDELAHEVVSVRTVVRQPRVVRHVARPEAVFLHVFQDFVHIDGAPPIVPKRADQAENVD
jgi:hypothetical protein